MDEMQAVAQSAMAPKALTDYKSVEWATVIVYNILGQEVATLVDGEFAAGSYSIPFRTADYSLSSGLYFYRLVTPHFVDVKKMMMVK